MRILKLAPAALAGLILAGGLPAAGHAEAETLRRNDRQAPTAATHTAIKRAQLSRRTSRIVIHPAPRYGRQCVDWYAVEQRPSGPVITPHMRCWWVYR